LIPRIRLVRADENRFQGEPTGGEHKQPPDRRIAPSEGGDRPGEGTWRTVENDQFCSPMHRLGRKAKIGEGL